MPSNNNTTGLGLSGDLASSLARQIDSAMSYDNIDAELEHNPRLQSLLKSVKNMVQGFLDGDKTRIIGTVRPQSLPAIDKLSPAARAKALTEECAKCLLASLSEKDLTILLRKAVAEQQKVFKQVGLAEAAKSKMARQYVKNSKDYLNFEDKYSAMANQRDSKEQIKLLIRDGGGKYGTFAMDKALANKAFPKLQKELEAIFNESRVSKADLAVIAAKLDIQLREGQSYKDLRGKIINVVITYAALVEGKEQGIHASRFTEPMVAQINDILKLTSFGYLTGEVSLNDTYISERKKKAKDARRQIAAITKNIKGRNETDNKIKLKQKKVKGKDKYDEYGNRKTYTVASTKKVLGVFSTKKRKRNASAFDKVRDKIAKSFNIEKNAQTGLYEKTDKTSDADLKRLYNFAESFGISNPEEMTIQNIIDELAQQAAGEVTSVSEDYANAVAEKDPKKRNALLKEIKAREENSMLTVMNKQKESYNQDFSDKIPVVSYNNAGEITSETISMAVPVWVVGQGGPGVTYGGDKSIADSKKDKNDKGNLAAFDSILGELIDDNEFKKKAKKGKGRHTKAVDAEKLLADIRANGNAKEETTTEKSTVTPVAATPIIPQNASVNLAVGGVPNVDAVQVEGRGTKTKNKNMIKKGYNQLAELTEAGQAAYKENQNKDYKLDLSQKEFKFGKDAEGRKKKLKLKSYKNYISSVGLKVWSEFKPSNENVLPVFDINKSHEISSQIAKSVLGVERSVDAINGTVSQLPTMWSTLQEGGLTFNAAASGGILAQVMGAISTGTAVVGQDIQNSAKMATGGSVSGLSSSSTIITGDPRRTTPSKPNPELVNVDWKSKKINVTPIPQFATGGKMTGNNTSNVTNISRMTSSERSKPMSVGISSNLVTYSKTLSDVTDSNDKTAIKVYSINSGINEKIKVGETELSLFDAVYGIFGTVATISENINSQLQLQTQIAAGITALNSTTKTIAGNMNNNSSGGFEFSNSFDSMLRGE